MGFDFGGWMSGAGSAVDRFLGGTGGEPLPAGTQSQISSDGYETIPSTPVVIQEVVAPIQPVIPENYTNIEGSDEQGTYKAVITDTSTPATQAFVEGYVDASKTGEIDRIGYTKQADIGDSRTQELIKQNYSPLQATALQRDEQIAKLMAKGYTRDQALESREVRYYTNEAKKAVDSIDAMSASKHYDAMRSGLPQGPNEFEHAGDLARQFGYKIEGVSNVPGTQKGDPLTIPFKGSFLADANIITKTQRTGEMGDYGKLPLPFSSTLGSLDLKTQQAIGRQAAASALASGKEGPQSGWKVDEHAMDKYTPELAKGAGWNLAYKEATFGGIGSKTGSKDATSSIMSEEGVKKPFVSATANNAVDIASGKGKSYQVEMEDGSMVTRYESDLNPLANLFSQAKDAPALTMGKDTVIKSPGITAGTINDYLLPEDRVIIGGKSDYKVEIPGVKTESKPTKSAPVSSETVQDNPPLVAITGASKQVDYVDAPTSNWINRMSGGRAGGDVSAGGLQLYKSPEHPTGLLYPLKTVKGSAMDRGDLGFTILGTRYRKSMFSKPHIKRKKSVAQPKVQPHVPKPDPKVLDLSFLNKNMTPVYMGADSFKFKGVSLDSIIKPTRARTSTKTTVNISPVLGLKKGKNISKDVNIDIKLPKGKTNVYGNVSAILSSVKNPLKAIKNIKIK